MQQISHGLRRQALQSWVQCGRRPPPAGPAWRQSRHHIRALTPPGPTIKVGSLNSLSGTMAISEVTVRDAIALAVEQINASGGVMGKQIQLVGEDGASEPTVLAEKAEKLISSDCVAAVFGGWTSSSRKAMLPVFESANALLYYPVQYEGLESSKNIFYTGDAVSGHQPWGADGHHRERHLPQ